MYWKNFSALVSILLLLSACSSDQYSELMSAASLGDVEGMQRIMARGGEVNERSKYGKSALMLAAAGGHLDAVNVLIARGASINAQDSNGTTALIAAATNDQNDCVRALLTNGADPGIRDNAGNSAFLNAVFFRFTDVVKTMLEHQDKLLPEDKTEAMLMVAGLGYNDVLSILLEAGLDINTVGYRDRTPLMAAIAFNHPETVALLLKRGADTSTADADNKTPLQLAEEEGSKAILELLQADHKQQIKKR